MFPLILDFDGNLTNAEEEGVGFLAGCYDDLARATGWSLERVLSRAGEIEAGLLAHPDQHAWIFDGIAVAPAVVDPYLRIKPIANEVLEEAGVSGFPIMEMYDRNYPKSGIHFRPGTEELLVELMHRNAQASIVTNSATDPVQAKIRILGMDLVDRQCMTLGGNFTRFWTRRVHGSAKKFMPGEVEGVQRELWLPGLDRPVHLHRPHYYQILNKLRGDVAWEQVTVVGDNFELDLALPLALGSRVGLMVNDKTPRYEIDFLRDHARSRILTDVSQILSFYDEVHASAA